jgi:hypothetical protein
MIAQLVVGKLTALLNDSATLDLLGQKRSELDVEQQFSRVSCTTLL